jgi:hypothetical protein
MLKKFKDGGINVLGAGRVVFHINVKYVKLYSVNPVINLEDVKKKAVVGRGQHQIKGDTVSDFTQTHSQRSTRGDHHSCDEEGRPGL